MKVGVKKLATSLYHTVWNLFRYIGPRRRGSRVWRTDRQNGS